MTAATQYQNELEQNFNKLPGILQDALRPAYQPVDDAIKWVCGDPQALVNAGATYNQIGQQVTQLAQTIQQSVTTLESSWTDTVGQVFQQRMDNVNKALTAAGQGLSDTQKILNAGADAAVQAANTICEIVVSVIEFIITDFLIATAASWITFGASEAAGVVAAIAEWARGVEQVAKVAEQIAKILEQIAKILEEIAKLFEELGKLFEELKKLQKEASFITKYTTKLVPKALTGMAISKSWNAIPVLPNIPSGVGTAVDAGKSAINVSDDVAKMDAVDGN